MKSHRRLALIAAVVSRLLCLAGTPAGSQEAADPPAGAASPPPQRARLRWTDFAAKSEDWFRSPAAAEVLDNLLSHQSAEGIWPKNTDTFGTRFAGEPQALRGTFDNGATVGECRFLARVGRQDPAPRADAALRRALDRILEAQYRTGGWPQTHPPGPGYARHITFNDGTMIHLLELLRDVAGSPEFARCDPSLSARAGRAVERGIQCILDCQVRRGDRLTVWCAQHDAVSLEPRGARTYEHPSLSGAESAGIVRFLMSLDRPTPEIVRAVNSACAWFEESRITGLRQVWRNGDKMVVPDPTAPPLWARFYELSSNRPIFSGRDGVVRYALADIEAERRNGYAWYGDWGTTVLHAWTGWRKNLAPAP